MPAALHRESGFCRGPEEPRRRRRVVKAGRAASQGVAVTFAGVRGFCLAVAVVAAVAGDAFGRPLSQRTNEASHLSGLASVYDRSSGAQTASGESLRPEAMTAAHPTLPFGTVVMVTNHRNGHTAVVRINDRGPFVRGRVIDVSPAAAQALGFSGTTQVSLAVVSASEAENLTVSASQPER
jgi:rare lipoprotein A